MKRKIVSVAGAAIALAMWAAQANAGYTYDLRVTNGPSPATDNGHSVLVPLAGDYTAELWGQITGDTTFTNDSLTAAFVTLKSNVSSTSAFTGTGNGVTNLVAAPALALSVVGLQSNVSNDGIADWGSGDILNQATWSLLQNSSAVVAGGSVGHQLGSNGWEMLLGTYTIHVSGVNPLGQTSFNVVAPIVEGTNGNSPGGAFAWSAPPAGKYKPVNVTIDGVVITGSQLTLTSSTVSTGTGVTFGAAVVPIPEPASLGVLALGGLALLARRRKTA